MNILRHLGTAMLLLVMAATKSLAQDSKQVFIYNPDERGGLRIAQQTADGWQEIGQLCSTVPGYPFR